jgi:OmcA/MtrC family decaheme c-type cytochrome
MLPLAASAATRRAVTPPASTSPAPATTSRYTPSQLEAYLSDDGIAYIRPGFHIKVNSVTIGTDRKPVLDLSFTDDLNQPLDRLGQTTPGALSLSFTLAWYNPATRQYTSYITRTATAAAPSKQIGTTATQAATDSGGKFADLATGHATYTYNTALPASFDATKTHTIGIYATRNLTAQIGKNYFANVEYDFRPDGNAVTEKWDKINQAASCNNCHDPLSAHGGARQDVKLCAQCHQPQSTDPDSGNTVDFKVMIHKIHDGNNLPSVKAGTPYQIIGFGQSVNDFSTVAFPQNILNCQNCHEGTNPNAKPVQSTVYLTNPSRAACGSCHDNINWTTGANHPAGAQADDSACASCHVPDSGQEFDASIKGAHVVPEKSKQLKGLSYTIVSATNLAAGKKPTVVFSIKNADGSAVDGSKLATFAPIFAGPTSSYTTFFRESGVPSSSNTNVGVFDATAGTTTYTFTHALPANAGGTWSISADVYRNATLKHANGKADTSVREAAFNNVKYYAVTGSVTPRRASVALTQCNTCHDRLALHGGQRMNTEECVICHNPTNSDVANRPAAAGPVESISFQRLIHRIHSGEDLTQDFTVYGFGGSANNFNEVRFPGDRKNCAKCHVGTAYTLPLPTGIDSVTTLRDYFTPQGPGTAACLGCHDNRDAAAHAYLNTTQFGGTGTPAEACATCHGTGKDWAVDKVHAR